MRSVTLADDIERDRVRTGSPAGAPSGPPRFVLVPAGRTARFRVRGAEGRSISSHLQSTPTPRLPGGNAASRMRRRLQGNGAGWNRSFVQLTKLAGARSGEKQREV